MSTPAQVLVMAKAPVPGRVKTRLGWEIGPQRAAELAAAALLDTVEACSAYSPAGCYLALDGALRSAIDGLEIGSRLSGWTVLAQGGAGLAERLANALASVPGPVVQIGMDTPQLVPADLADVVAGLSEHDAVLAPAEDGGWWALALRDPRRASALRTVEMSTPTTHRDTLAALRRAGLSVGEGSTRRDVDTLADARAVAATSSGRFARAFLSEVGWAR
jgi:rSAM/selenodomain-associated transferase 1